jgi:hypothetical protein
MFKESSLENELYRSMEKQLVSNQVESRYGFDKLARAIDCLNAAAQIFEQADMSDISDDISQVLSSLTEAIT